MKLERFRVPAIAGSAVLLIAGATSVFAASPTPSTPAADATASQVEPIGTDADTLQQGDQTTPDVAGAAGAAGAASEDPAAAETAADASETAGTTGAEADGPGGHADPAGQNVDHQFDGAE